MVAGSDPDYGLVESVDYGNMEVVRLLLENGANPDVRDKNSGETPLIRAVHRDLADFLKLLLDNGANVNARDRSKYTALKYAQKTIKELGNR